MAKPWRRKTQSKSSLSGSGFLHKEAQIKIEVSIDRHGGDRHQPSASSEKVATSKPSQDSFDFEGQFKRISLENLDSAAPDLEIDAPLLHLICHREQNFIRLLSKRRRKEFPSYITQHRLQHESQKARRQDKSDKFHKSVVGGASFGLRAFLARPGKTMTGDSTSSHIITKTEGNDSASLVQAALAHKEIFRMPFEPLELTTAEPEDRPFQRKRLATTSSADTQKKTEETSGDMFLSLSGTSPDAKVIEVDATNPCPHAGDLYLNVVATSPRQAHRALSDSQSARDDIKANDCMVMIVQEAESLQGQEHEGKEKKLERDSEKNTFARAVGILHEDKHRGAIEWGEETKASESPISISDLIQHFDSQSSEEYQASKSSSSTSVDLSFQVPHMRAFFENRVEGEAEETVLKKNARYEESVGVDKDCSSSNSAKDEETFQGIETKDKHEENRMKRVKHEADTRNNKATLSELHAGVEQRGEENSIGSSVTPIASPKQEASGRGMAGISQGGAGSEEDDEMTGVIDEIEVGTWPSAIHGKPGATEVREAKATVQTAEDRTVPTGVAALAWPGVSGYDDCGPSAAARLATSMARAPPLGARSRAKSFAHGWEGGSATRTRVQTVRRRGAAGMKEGRRMSTGAWMTANRRGSEMRGERRETSWEEGPAIVRGARVQMGRVRRGISRLRRLIVREGA